MTDPAIELQLAALSKSKDAEVRRVVASHPNATNEILGYLAKDPKLSVRIEVFKNPATPACVLTEAVGRGLTVVEEVMWIARHRNTPEYTLTELATALSDDVRFWVARNPNTPEEALHKLSQDKNEWIADAANANPRANPETFHIADMRRLASPG